MNKPTYTKEEVMARVRKELELTNKLTNTETVIGGLTDADIQIIAIISLALRETNEPVIV